MTRAARYAYLVLAWAFLAGLVVQVFYAGLGIFAGSQNFKSHVDLGWALHLAPLLVLAAAAAARAGSRHWQWALGLAAVVFVVPILALARDTTPTLAAFHPVAAVVASWLAVKVALNALGVVRASAAVAG